MTKETEVLFISGARGSELDEALCYKPKGRGFDSRWCHGNFLLTQTPTETSTRNIYWRGGKGSRYVGLTNLPPSCADCLEIWEPKPPGTLRVRPSL